MKSNAAVAAAFLACIAAGCASTGASDTPNPSNTPAVTTSAPPPPAPPTPSATPSATPTPPAPSPSPINAGPLVVANEYSFGPDNFGGVLLGQSFEGYGLSLGNAVRASACGDAVFPSLYPTAFSPAGWELFLMLNWDDPSVAPDDYTVKSFLLVVPNDPFPTTQRGPVGPRGIRLGTPESTVEAMFPAEAAASTTRQTTYYDFATDAEVTVTERVFTMADVGGGPMVITTLDGHVVTIMWGNDPAYVSQSRGFLRCLT